MSTLEVLGLMIIVAVVLVWRITWLATRVHRATVRAERTWSVLDAALVGRAQRAAELVVKPGIDPPRHCLCSMLRPLPSSRSCDMGPVSGPRVT